MAWAKSIQTASFKGIVFDVLAIEDAVERSIVEHQYAYSEGADLEDMGSTGREVTITAIFYGDRYESSLGGLLDYCEVRESGLLVHPVMGRMPNMQLFSARFRHEADNVDYVEFDLIFKKANRSTPLFEMTSMFGMLDNILNQIDSMINLVGGVYDGFMGKIRAINTYKSRVRGMNAIVRSMQSELSYQLGELNIVPSSSSSGSDQNFMTSIHKDTQQLVTAKRVNNPISSMSEYEAVKRELNAVNAMPVKVAQGNSRVDLGVPMTVEDAKEIQIFIQLMTQSIRTSVVVDLLERDDLNPNEIETLVNDARTSAQQIIDRIRKDDFMRELNEYDELFVLVESLRASQHSLKQIAEIIISKRPPLLVRRAPFDGTLHQIAHHFYQDFKRYDELVKLNPHITHPSFIQTGDFINGYAE
ncbi:DNA circularization protein [Wohlfahrtiimonas larvae]|uniref:DNA circularization protein n=1 Tax=Wohlfahrtiimonas larvae TaxID=1157986 RepID=A0ABP9MZZ4_9GAMM|nr:DNA circularization N-terminal domain-containing protein [Wohlfahrtiimonas larvae]